MIVNGEPYEKYPENAPGKLFVEMRMPAISQEASEKSLSIIPPFVKKVVAYELSHALYLSLGARLHDAHSLCACYI